jgi:nucleoside-diphosphate-sugar epimerase
MNLLITGSSGFVGNYVAHVLQNKHRLLRPSHAQVDLASNPVELNFLVHQEGVKTVLHLAHPRLFNLPNAMAEAILMMRNVLEISRLNDLNLVYLSSLSVFSGYNGCQFIPSATKVLPNTAYGQTKAICEYMVQIYRELYGIRSTILRPGHVYGAGMDRDRFITKSIDRLKKGDRITIHRYDNGIQEFDFLYITDLVDAISNALETCTESKVLNIGTGTRTSLLEVVEIIKRLTESSSELVVKSVSGTIPSLIVDPSEALLKIGWKSQVSLHDGIRNLVHLFVQPS